MIQAGATKCNPRPRYAKVIWTNIDSGVNIHISNCTSTVFNQIPSNKTVDQADGTATSASATCNWTFRLGNRFVRSKGVFLMPNNPTCTLGSAALKLNDGYTNTHHDQFNFAAYVHADGTSFSFTKENNLLRTINALDYVPLIYYLNSLPDEHTPICKQLQLRRSNRIRRPTAKMKAIQDSQNKPKDKQSYDVSPLPSSTSTDIDNITTSSEQAVASNKNDSAINSDRSYATNTTSSNQFKDKISPSHIKSETNDVFNDKFVSGSLSSLITHLKFGCRNHKSLKHMHLTNAIDNMPSVKLPKTPCPICLLVKNTRLPKNKESHMGSLKPGQLMMMDFGFFSTYSVRGYVAYLSITCQATGYGYIFPVPNKRPPLSLISWIAETLKRIDHQMYFVRFDEGGELARSQQVCQLLTSLNIIMQTTGGYASNLLGKDERQHRTIAEMITSMLYSANLPAKYWCFAIMYAIYVKRRWCNYPNSATPFEQ